MIHLTAIAGRLGIPLPLSKFDELARSTPTLANIQPCGKYLMEDFYYAGGVQALMKLMLPLLHGDEMTVSGKTIAQNVEKSGVPQPGCHPVAGGAFVSGWFAGGAAGQSQPERRGHENFCCLSPSAAAYRSRGGF